MEQEMRSPPDGQTQKSLEYKVEVDRSGDFTFVVKGNVKKILRKVYEIMGSIKLSIFIRWFLN